MGLRSGTRKHELNGRTREVMALARNARTSVEMIDKFYAKPLRGEMNICPRIPPAGRTDAEHPQCASTTPGGGQADGLALRFASDLRPCSAVPCAWT